MKNFFMGVFITVIGGLVLWSIVDWLERKPNVYWFTTSNFIINKNYLQGLTKLEAAYQQTLTVGNRGSRTAKSIRLILEREPIDIQVKTDGEVVRQKLQDSREAIVISELGKDAEINVVISGIIGPPEIFFDGKNITPEMGKLSRSCSPLWPWLFMGGIAFATLLAVMLGQRNGLSQYISSLEKKIDELTPRDNNPKSDKET